MTSTTHRTRLGLCISFALTLAVFICLDWFSYQNLIAENEADRVEKHTYLVIEELGKFLSSLQDAETGQRGFIITGDRQYLAPYYDGCSIVQVHLATLRSLTRDNRDQQKRLDSIEVLTRTKLSELDGTIKLRTTKGFIGTRNVIAKNLGKKTMDDIRGLVARAELAEEQLLNVRRALEKEYSSRSFEVLFGGGIIGVVIIVTLYGFLWGEYTRRIRNESRLTAKRAALATYAAELESANGELEAFNHTVAHDLRQPLNVIGLYCQSVNMQCGNQLGECASYIQKIHTITLQMNHTIGALLNFARVGHMEPRREAVDLCMLAHEVAKLLKLTSPERQVDFRIANGVVAYGDADLMRVVLENLLGNAWKHTSMREKAVIELGVKDIEGVPSYFVRDNGAGFDMTDAAKLFTPFHRLPEAEKYKGFGIGLATVERIIRRHGGKIWAEGEVDKGATFYFTVPRIEFST